MIKNIILKRKLKGSSLLFIVTISTIIAILLSMMMLALLHNNNQNSEFLITSRLHRNLASAINIALNESNIPLNDSVSMTLGDKNQDSIKTIKKPFGVYHYILVKAFANHRELQKSALIGNKLLEQDRYALYLSNNNRPLSLSGKTQITGKVFLPEAGIRKAYIEDHAYQGKDNPVTGSISISEKNLHPLDSTMLGYLRHFFNELNVIDDYETMESPDTLTHSFYKPTILLHHPTRELQGTLKGNIIVFSWEPILIKKNAQLEDILLFAPSIQIEEGFTGQLQLFAQDSIYIGKDCLLNYPSSIGLLTKKEQESEDPYLQINEGTIVNGLVFSSQLENTENPTSLIDIAPNATINGQVYADGLLQLQGRVNGITQCTLFSLQTESTQYDNFILNGQMDVSALSPYYIGNPLLNTGTYLDVIKWLN